MASTMAIIYNSAITCLYLILGLFISPIQSEVKVLPANFNPQSDICFRYSHQTAVIDKRLYVDGGIIQIERSNANYSSPYFAYYDLTTTFKGPTDIQVPPYITDKLQKRPSEVPSLAGGTLWADTINKRLFLYGGMFTASSPSPFMLWSYDAIYDTWATIPQPKDSSGAPVSIARLYDGASAVAQPLGLAFYFGGWISRESEYGYEGKNIAVEGLLVYDMVNNIWGNKTFDARIGRRAEGVLIHVPLGDRGLLIAFGGVRVSEDGNRTAVPMSEITIHDIASGRWYIQTATGEIPESRSFFCAGLASGNVQGPPGTGWTLQNIYLYGGAPTSGGPGFDDVYVLTLPSFTWTKFWPATNINSNPHQRLTCDVILNSYMLILGGFFPPGSECDSRDSVGLHNLNLSGSESTIWTKFPVKPEDYKVPTAIINNLNLTEDRTGITFVPGEPDIATLVFRPETIAPRTPTRDVSPTSGLSSRDRTIVIATTIPCGILILASVFFCIRWYKRRTAAMATDAPLPPPIQETSDINTIQVASFSRHNPTPSLASTSSPSAGDPTFMGSPAPAPIAAFEQIPVAYVLNPAGGFTPVYSPTAATPVIGNASPPGSHNYGRNRQGYGNNGAGRPMELPAEEPKPYSF